MRTECCLNHDYCSQSNESDCQEISFEILYSQRFCINSLTAIVKGIAETYVSYWSEAKLKAELLLMVVCANSYRITSINLNVCLCILLQVYDFSISPLLVVRFQKRNFASQRIMKAAPTAYASRFLL